MHREFLRSIIGLVFVLVLSAVTLATAQGRSADEVRRLGRQAYVSGYYVRAEQFFRAALQAFESNGDASRDDVVETLADLSSTLISQERYRDAEQILVRALDSLKAHASSNIHTKPIVLGNLGTVYQLTGRSKLAEAAFRDGLQASNIAIGREAAYSGILLSNLGALHAQTGNDKEAEKDIRKALAIAEKIYGEDSVELEPMLTNLAALYQRRGKWAVAESVLNRTLMLVEQALGPDHPDMSMLLEHLAVVHFKQNKLQQAEQELRRALEIERRITRAEGIQIAHISVNLARVLTAQGVYAEARNLYSDALERQERSLGSNHSEVAATLEQYAKLLHNMKSDDALALQMESRAKRIRAELALTVRIEK